MHLAVHALLTRAQFGCAVAIRRAGCAKAVLHADSGLARALVAVRVDGAGSTRAAPRALAVDAVARLAMSVLRARASTGRRSAEARRGARWVVASAVHAIDGELAWIAD